MSYREVYEKWLNSPALSDAEKAELQSIAGDDKEIETRSIGEEPLRRVLVCPVGGQRRERDRGGRRPQRRGSRFN